jgi:hypothetical protein
LNSDNIEVVLVLVLVLVPELRRRGSRPNAAGAAGDESGHALQRPPGSALAGVVGALHGWMDGWIRGNEGELKLSVCLIVASLVRNSALSDQQLLNLIASD